MVSVTSNTGTQMNRIHTTVQNLSTKSNSVGFWKSCFRLACILACAHAGNAAAQAQNMDALVAAAKTEGKLTLYTSSVDVETQELAKKFEEAYPGIKVEWLRLTSTALFSRYAGEVEANVHNVDVLYSASSQLYQLKPQLFQKLTPALVPSLSALQVKAKNDSYAVAEILPHVITYNSALVSKADLDKLKSWKDLADPRWKGKIALTDPKTTTNVVSWLMLMRDTYGDEWIKTFAGQYKIVNSAVPGVQQAAAGAFQVVVPTVVNHSADVRAQGAPLAVLRPEGPSHGLEVAIALALKPPHPNAARLYVNWKLGQAGVALVCKGGAVPTAAVPAGMPCAKLAPNHVGSNDLVTPEQTRKILDQLGVKS